MRGGPPGFGGVLRVLSYSVAARPPRCGLGIQNKILARQSALGSGQEPQGTRVLLFHEAPALCRPRRALAERPPSTSAHCAHRPQQPPLLLTPGSRLPHQGPVVLEGCTRGPVHEWGCAPYTGNERVGRSPCLLPAECREAPTPLCPQPPLCVRARTG